LGRQGRQHGFLTLLRAAAQRILRGLRVPPCPRANNEEADRLSKIGSTKQDIPGRRVYVGERGAREGGWGGLTTTRHGQAWAAPPGGEPGSQPLSISSSSSVGLLVK
jgi:hypothetical protein